MIGRVAGFEHAERPGSIHIARAFPVSILRALFKRGRI